MLASYSNVTSWKTLEYDVRNDYPENYMSLTADNFLVTVESVSVGSKADVTGGKVTLSKSYNDGILKFSFGGYGSQIVIYGTAFKIYYIG